MLLLFTENTLYTLFTDDCGQFLKKKSKPGNLVKRTGMIEQIIDYSKELIMSLVFEVITQVSK